jgi:uncharacterized protein (DUF433 family)
VSPKDDIERRLLEIPLYAYSEADYLAGTSRGTAKRWLTGYEFRASGGKVVRRPPVTPQTERDEKGVSFLDLVELAAIGGLKEIGFTLLQIRRVVDNCQQLFEIPRPLASLQFKVGGREVFVHTQEGDLVEVLQGRGRRAWDQVLGPFLGTLDYDHEVARRWWPLGRGGAVCVAPDYGFGLPVVSGSGVRTEIILERFQVGESGEEIAADFNLAPSQVESAIRFETSRLKRAA